MKYIISFPALAIVIAAYLLMAAGGDMLIDGDAYSMTLASGAEMTLSPERPVAAGVSGRLGWTPARISLKRSAALF